MIEEKMFFCKDCKHYWKYDGYTSVAEWNKHMCQRNTEPSYNLITGELHSSGSLFCEMERYDETDPKKCGPTARFFEPINKPVT